MSDKKTTIGCDDGFHYKCEHDTMPVPEGPFRVILEWARKWNRTPHLSVEHIRDLADQVRLPVRCGRTRIEMDDVEYARMRDALGEDWEWQGLTVIEVNGCLIDHEAAKRKERRG